MQCIINVKVIYISKFQKLPHQGVESKEFTRQETAFQIFVCDSENNDPFTLCLPTSSLFTLNWRVVPVHCPCIAQ